MVHTVIYNARKQNAAPGTCRIFREPGKDMEENRHSSPERRRFTLFKRIAFSAFLGAYIVFLLWLRFGDVNFGEWEFFYVIAALWTTTIGGAIGALYVATKNVNILSAVTKALEKDKHPASERRRFMFDINVIFGTLLAGMWLSVMSSCYTGDSLTKWTIFSFTTLVSAAVVVVAIGVFDRGNGLSSRTRDKTSREDNHTRLRRRCSTFAVNTVFGILFGNIILFALLGAAWETYYLVPIVLAAVTGSAIGALGNRKARFPGAGREVTCEAKRSAAVQYRRLLSGFGIMAFGTLLGCFVVAKVIFYVFGATLLIRWHVFCLIAGVVTGSVGGTIGALRDRNGTFAVAGEGTPPENNKSPAGRRRFTSILKLVIAGILFGGYFIATVFIFLGSDMLPEWVTYREWLTYCFTAGVLMAVIVSILVASQKERVDILLYKYQKEGLKAKAVGFICNRNRKPYCLHLRFRAQWRAFRFHGFQNI